MEDTSVGNTENGEDLDGQFDDLLSKELLKLSVHDRNHIQEEAHGVRCMAPEETPFLVQESLNKLTIEIDRIPNSQKRAYMLSQQRPACKAFVNSNDFRLRFLRMELFDCPAAAERIVRVCNALLNLFGWYALERPIRLSDFSSAEQIVIRKGRFQPLPFRDRSGRKIAIVFPGHEFLKARVMRNNASSNRIFQVKVMMYMSWVMGIDADTQRRGAVLVVWFDSKIEQSDTGSDIEAIKKYDKSHGISMLRACVVHICSPDTPFYRVQRSIISLGAGYWRKRLKSHLGEAVELRYILNGYGINTDTIPVSWTGNVKVGYLKQWLRIRQYLEDPSLRAQNICSGCKFCCKNFVNGSNVGECSLPIECPRLNDVLFKKGKSAKPHPGNAHFRNQIQTTYEQGQFQYSPDVAATDPATGIIEALVDHFFEKVEKGDFRVLMWNEKFSWWSILVNENIIRKKIESTVMGVVESASLPRTEITMQEPHLGSNNYFNAIHREQSTWTRSAQEDGSKRRKIAGDSQLMVMSNWDFGDSESNDKRCFG